MMGPSPRRPASQAVAAAPRPSASSSSKPAGRPAAQQFTHVPYLPAGPPAEQPNIPNRRPPPTSSALSSGDLLIAAPRVEAGGRDAADFNRAVRDALLRHQEDLARAPGVARPAPAESPNDLAADGSKAQEPPKRAEFKPAARTSGAGTGEGAGLFPDAGPPPPSRRRLPPLPSAAIVRGEWGWARRLAGGGGGAGGWGKWRFPTKRCVCVCVCGHQVGRVGWGGAESAQGFVCMDYGLCLLRNPLARA